MFTAALYVRARMHLRFVLLSKGYGRRQINQMLDAATDDTIDQAAVEAGVSFVQPVGAFGDGTIIQAIIDFLKSEQGQQLIAALIRIVLMAIGV